MKGLALYRTGKVRLVGQQPGTGRVQAEILGRGGSRVEWDGKHGGALQANCSACPPLGSYDKHCKHVAAALIAWSQAQEHIGTGSGELPEKSDPAGGEADSLRDREAVAGLWSCSGRSHADRAP